MGKSLVMLIWVMFVMWTGLAVLGWDERINSAAEEVKKKTSETVDDVREKTDSWSGLGYDKFNKAYKNQEEKAKETAENWKGSVEDAAFKAKDKINSAASGDKVTDTYNEARGKLHEASDGASHHAKETVEGAMKYGRDKSAHVYDETKEQLKSASNKVEGAMGSGTHKVVNAYDEAKNKVGEAYTSAKETISDEAKD